MTHLLVRCIDSFIHIIWYKWASVDIIIFLSDHKEKNIQKKKIYRTHYSLGRVMFCSIILLCGCNLHLTHCSKHKCKSSTAAVKTKHNNQNCTTHYTVKWSIISTTESIKRFLMFWQGYKSWDVGDLTKVDLWSRSSGDLTICVWNCGLTLQTKP